MKPCHKKPGGRTPSTAGSRSARETAMHRYPHPIRTTRPNCSERESLDLLLEMVTRQSEQIDELMCLVRGDGPGILKGNKS